MTTETTTRESLLLQGITTLVKKASEKEWTGTMTQLDKSLSSILGSKYRTNQPGSPSALRVVLNRVVSKLRNNRTSVKFWRDNGHGRTRLVRFSL